VATGAAKLGCVLEKEQDMDTEDITGRRLILFCTFKGTLYGALGGMFVGLIFPDHFAILLGLGLGLGLGLIFGSVNGIVLSGLAFQLGVRFARFRGLIFHIATVVTTAAVAFGLYGASLVLDYARAFEGVAFLVQGAVFYGSPALLISAICLANSAADLFPETKSRANLQEATFRTKK